VTVDMGDARAGRLEGLELRGALGADLIGVQTTGEGARDEGGEREKGPGVAIGDRRRRGHGSADKQVEMQADVERGERWQSVRGIRPSRRADHHGGRRHDAGSVGIENTTRHARCEAEIVGVNYQSLHGQQCKLRDMESVRADRADLFDPAVLASMGHIEIVARWVVDGFLSGLHRSPRKGFSVEFAEFRPYQPGDDLRYVDWKIAARADRWVVKQFEEETNLRATMVLDVSRSMAWRGAPQRLTKLAYAERLTAALALLLLRQRDAVGLVRVDDVVRTVVTPRARSTQWRRIVRALDEAGGGRASRIADGLVRASQMVRRPGMVVLLSDLLTDIAPVGAAIRTLAAAGHDITVLHVMDPGERDLALAGEALYVDPETDEEVPATVAEVRDAYRATVEAAIGEWRDVCGRAGARYETVMTDTPFGVPLRRAFSGR
jgi:hypothetical protein